MDKVLNRCLALFLSGMLILPSLADGCCQQAPDHADHAPMTDMDHHAVEAIDIDIPAVDMPIDRLDQLADCDSQQHQCECMQSSMVSFKVSACAQSSETALHEIGLNYFQTEPDLTLPPPKRAA